MIICDTDIMIDILRGHPAAITWFDTIRDETVALPGIVMMELLQCCRSKAEQQRLQKFFRNSPILWPSAEACSKALKHFAANYFSHGIGILDALIAETSVEARYPLHTFNQKHYLPHPLLKIKLPYAR